MASSEIKPVNPGDPRPKRRWSTTPVQSWKREDIWDVNNKGKIFIWQVSCYFNGLSAPTAIASLTFTECKMGCLNELGCKYMLWTPNQPNGNKGKCQKYAKEIGSVETLVKTYNDVSGSACGLFIDRVSETVIVNKISGKISNFETHSPWSSRLHSLLFNAVLY